MLSNSSHSVRVTTRIEAYSCKSVASERKMMKSLDQEFATDLETSVSSSSPDGIPATSLESAFGRLDRKDCRKTFWLLIATLNAAYPDHNFSRIKVEDFQAESARTVLVKLSEALELDQSGSDFASTLGALSTSPECIPKGSSENPQISPLGQPLLAGVHPWIDQVLDPVIDLAHCEVYSYSPDPDSDPHAVVSDDEEDVESVAFSIYGSSKIDVDQDLTVQAPEDTMWEIEGVEAPFYSHSDTTALPSRGSYNLPTRTISTPSSPPSRGDSHPLFSNRVERLVRSNTQPDCSSITSLNPPECQGSSVCDFSSSHGTNYEEESAGGLLWSSHYFFHNRKKKRVLFISTWGRKALMSSGEDESWISYQGRHEVDYPANSYSISPTMVGHEASWENSLHTTPPTDNITATGGLATYPSGSNHHSSNLRRQLASNLSKRLDLTYKPQSFKRTVDPSETPASASSVTALTRPLKKMRSKRNL